MATHNSIKMRLWMAERAENDDLQTQKLKTVFPPISEPVKNRMCIVFIYTWDKNVNLIYFVQKTKGEKKMKCKNCGTEANGGNFCPSCGEKQEPIAVDTIPAETGETDMKDSNNEDKTNAVPVSDIVNAVRDDSASVADSAEPGAEKGIPVKKKKKNTVGKKAAAVLVLLCVVALGVVVGLRISGTTITLPSVVKKSSAPKFVHYTKKSGGQYVRFFNEDSNQNIADSLGGYVSCYDDNFNRLFFIDEYGVLYYMNMGEKTDKRVPVKIDDSVNPQNFISVSGDGKAVFYLKFIKEPTRKLELYRYDFAEKTKLFDSPVYFLHAPEQKQILVYKDAENADEGTSTKATSSAVAYPYYANKKYDYFVIDENGTVTATIKNASCALCIDKDELRMTGEIICDDKSIYVFNTKEGLFKIGDYDSSLKISEMVYTGDKCVYYTAERADDALSGYITDRKASSDKMIEAPDMNAKMYWKSWHTDSFGRDHVSEYNWQLINAAQKEYKDKEKRDRLRKDIAEGTLSATGISGFDLYCCKDGKSERIAERVKLSDRVSFLEQTNGVLAFSSYTIADETHDLYDLFLDAKEHDSDVFEELRNALVKDITDYAAVNGKIFELQKNSFGKDNKQSIRSFYNTAAVEYYEKDSSVYFVAGRDSETSCGTLYKAKIGENGIGEKELVCENVELFMFTSDGRLVTVRNSKADIDNSGELFVGDKKVDDNVHPMYDAYPGFGIVKEAEDGTLTYAKEYFGENHTFTLCRYDGRGTVDIAKNVTLWDSIGKDDFVFVTCEAGADGDSKKETLSRYSNGKITVIDEDTDFFVMQPCMFWAY